MIQNLQSIFRRSSLKGEYGRNYYRLKHGDPPSEEEKAQKLIDRAKKLIEQKSNTTRKPENN